MSKVSAKAFIFHMSFLCPCDHKHLWNWPLSGASVFHKHILLLGTRTHKPLKPSQKVIVKASVNLRKKKKVWSRNCVFDERINGYASFLIELSSRKNIYFLLIKRPFTMWEFLLPKSNCLYGKIFFFIKGYQIVGYLTLTI